MGHAYAKPQKWLRTDVKKTDLLRVSFCECWEWPGDSLPRSHDGFSRTFRSLWSFLCLEGQLFSHHFVTLLPCQTQNSAHASSSSHLLWFPPPSYLVFSLVLGLSVTLSFPTCVGPHALPVTWHTLSLPVISWFAFSSLSRASSSSCVPELSASSPLQCTFCPSICISHK